MAENDWQAMSRTVSNSRFHERKIKMNRTQRMPLELQRKLRVVGRNLQQMSDSLKGSLCDEQKVRQAEQSLERARRTWKGATQWIRENPDKVLESLKAGGLSDPEERLAAILRSFQGTESE